MAGQPGALAALAAGLGGWNEGKDEQRRRMMEDEQRQRQDNQLRRQSALQGIQMQGALQDVGAERIDNPALARLVAPGELGKRIAAGDSPLMSKDTQTFALPDMQDGGAILNYRINPDKTREARADQRMEARDTRTADRMTALERMRGQSAESVAGAKAAQSGAEDTRKNQAQYNALKLSYPSHPVAKTAFAPDVDYSRVFQQAMAEDSQAASDARSARTMASGRNAGMREQRAFQREQALQQDFQQNPVVKNAYGIGNAIAQIRAAAASVDNPQGDLDIIYNVVKVRDPNSVVREGEIDLQRAARSLGTQVALAWKKAKSGRMLSPQERDQIVALLGVKQQAAESQVRPVQADFGRRARQFGADSAFVAPNPFAGAGTGNASASSNAGAITQVLGGGQTPLLNKVRRKP